MKKITGRFLEHVGRTAQGIELSLAAMQAMFMTSIEPITRLSPREGNRERRT